jgi:hypothetical protein
MWRSSLLRNVRSTSAGRKCAENSLDQYTAKQIPHRPTQALAPSLRAGSDGGTAPAAG